MREGTIPTALGAVVAGSAAALRTRDIRRRGLKERDIVPRVETALLGFGLAHVVLGTIDLFQNRR